MKKDQSGGSGGHPDLADSARSMTKSPSLAYGGRSASRQQQDRKGGDKPSSLQFGPPGAVNCQVFL